MRIADLLPTKQREAVSYQRLSELTGLSQRDLRYAIRRERREGAAILTSHKKGCSGVWLWDGQDKTEFDRCYDTLVHTGIDLLETARFMKERLSSERT